MANASARPLPLTGPFRAVVIALVPHSSRHRATRRLDVQTSGDVKGGGLYVVAHTIRPPPFAYGEEWGTRRHYRAPAWPIPLTGPFRAVVIAIMPEEAQSRSAPIHAVLCIDRDALIGSRGVLRHLLVGLVDQAIQLRVVSDDARVDTLLPGPVQAVLHQSIVWPFARRRIETVVGELAATEPTVVHAIGGGSYRVADAIARAFDADLILQVLSLADCDAVERRSGTPAACLLAASQPLAAVLTDRLAIDADRVHLVRPGILASSETNCFADPQRLPTVLTTSPLRRGSGVERLVEAVAILKKREHNLLLFLLGKGAREGAIRRLIRDRKLSSCVTLSRPAGNLSEAIHSADIFVLPAAPSSVSANSLHAMGAGVAIVACGEGICDHLHDGETAVVCENATPATLADCIERLIADTDEARRLAGVGRDYVKQHHAVSTMAEATADAYGRLALAHATFSIGK